MRRGTAPAARHIRPELFPGQAAKPAVGANLGLSASALRPHGGTPQSARREQPGRFVALGHKFGCWAWSPASGRTARRLQGAPGFHWVLRRCRRPTCMPVPPRIAGEIRPSSKTSEHSVKTQETRWLVWVNPSAPGAPAPPS